jgi:hypothetical protein
VLRLNHAQLYFDRTSADWSRVIFIDEFGEKTGRSGKTLVWRLRGTCFQQEDIQERAYPGHSGITFIVSFSFHGIGPIARVDRLNKNTYCSYLESRLIPYIEKHYDDR